MKHLTAGSQSPERLSVLLRGTSIRSESIIEGLSWHLVTGHPIESAAALAQIKPANLHRALETVEAVASLVEQVKELDWTHLVAIGRIK